MDSRKIILSLAIAGFLLSGCSDKGGYIDLGDTTDQVLKEIGEDDDNNASDVSIADLKSILPALKNINASKEKAYQDYIADPAHVFSAPATRQEVQDMIDAVNATPDPLPADITITDDNLTAYIVSTFDNTPYSPAIDVQGVIDMGSTPSGILVNVPYTVVNDTVVLPKYSKTFTIASSSTEDNESGIVATFAWKEQTLAEGSGTFKAYITIDDSAGDNDNVYNAKKLDIDDNSTGLVAATFDYATDSNGGTGTTTLKILPGIPDRNFNVQTNGKYEHNFIYHPVTNPTTGRTWLNNNLGADYANVNKPSVFNPSQQATASNDYLAYGSLFQWGRKADGHELINWANGSSGSGKYGTTSTKTDNPANSLFITTSAITDDWRITPDNTLWESEGSPNNVCPIGFRLPLNPNGVEDNKNEWYVETKTWNGTTTADALQNQLRLSLAGGRDAGGSVVNAGGKGAYLAGLALTPASVGLLLRGLVTFTNAGLPKAIGYTARCIKD